MVLVLESMALELESFTLPFNNVIAAPKCQESYSNKR